MKIKQFIKKFFNNRLYVSIFLFLCLFIVSILLDQLTKELIIKNLIPNVGDSVRVIPKVISFIFVKNTGAAWGIFSNSLVFLIIMTFLGMGLLMTFYGLRLKKVGKNSSLFLGICTGLIMGGAIGNLIDRLFIGYVRDFINFDFMTFPVFNFADVALTIGIFFMVIYILFIYSKETEKLEKSLKIVENNTKKAEINENIVENEEISHQREIEENNDDSQNIEDKDE